MTLVLLFTYLPVLMVVIYSFNDSRTAGAWAGFTTDWYGKLFQNRGLLDALGTSLVLAAWSVGLSAVIGTLGALGMARTHFRGEGLLELFSSLPMMIPEIILGMAYLAIFSAVGIPLGMPTLVVTHTTFCIPYVLINVKGRLVGMDPALEEAARDLGASPRRVLTDITLPIIRPAVVSGMLLALAMSLDDVVITFFVTGATTSTLPLKIYSSLKTGVTPEINALCTLMLGAVCVIVAIAQLYRIRQHTQRQKLMEHA